MQKILIFLCSTLLLYCAHTEQYTPLSRAPVPYRIVSINDTLTFRQILATDTSLQNMRFNDQTILEYAIQQNSISIINQIIKYPKLLNIHPAKTPLVLQALYAEDYEIGALLIQHISNPNRADDYYNTPLVWALINNKPGIVEMLLNQNIDVNYLTDGDHTPLGIAIQQSMKRSIIQLLKKGAQLQEGYSYTHWYPLLTFRDTTAFSLFLKNHSIDDLTYPENNAPVYVAALNGNYSLLKILLEHGFDANSTNNFNTTALHAALQNGNRGISRLLLQSGAFAGAQDNDGWTPLHLAVSHNYHDLTVQMLHHLKMGDIPNSDGITPLMLACGSGNLKIAKRLIETGSDIFRTDNNNNSCKEWAAKERQAEVITELYHQ